MKKFLLGGMLAICSASVIHAQTLVASYPMDGNALDVSGNSNNGTMNGTVIPVNDRFGNASSALFFNGGNISTSFFGVGGHNSRTISFWTKIDPSSNGGSPFGYGGGPTGGDFANNLMSNGGGWYFDVSNSAGTLSCRINDGAWHQYIITYDNTLAAGTAGCRFYRDGTELNNLIGPYNWNGEFINTYATTPLGMGNGIMSMDDFRMYAGAFTRSQVDSIYKAEAAYNSCLVAKYDFNTNGTDYSPSGNNASSVSASGDYDRFGNASGAFAFGGTPGIIAGPCTPLLIPDGSLPMGNTTRTVMAWIKTTNTTDDMVVMDYGTLGGGNRCALMVTSGTAIMRQDGIDMPVGNVADGQWHHVAFSCDGSSGSIFIDGIGTNSGPFNFNTISTSYLHVGETTTNGSSQTECFNGSIDDIRIFNCELTGTQIDSIYNIEKFCNLTVNVSVNNDVYCYSGNNGSATANVVSGGVAPYTYLWSPNSQTSQTPTDMYAGTHTVTVTDNVGCVGTATVTINEPTQLTATMFSVTHASCFNVCDGSATITQSGGTAPYTYLWDAAAGSQITQTALSLCGGAYICIVTDANGCTSSDGQIINNPNPVTATVSEIGSISCVGACDGILDASPAGGTGTYTSYGWNPGGITTQTATGLCAGSYTITIFDSNGCQGSSNYTLNDPAPISVNFISTPTYCAGSCDGALDAQPSGGAGGYTFSWSPGGYNTEYVLTLCAGNYTVTVTDANGCSISPVGAVNEPLPLSINVSSTNISCYGANDGTASSLVSGGTRPYYYYWTSGGNDSTELNTGPSANEIITVYDANGCTVKDSTVINEPAQITLSLLCTQASCGSSTGSITSTITGGIPPLTYLWNTGATTANINSLYADNYFLQVYDNTGCYGSGSIIITDSDGPAISLNSTTDVSCYGAKNGAIDIGVSGGTAPYSVEWSNAQLSEDIDSLSGGDYDVVVYDVNGCVAQASYWVNEPDAIFLDGSYIAASCGLFDGAAICNPSGGTTPFSYAWDATTGFQTNATASGLGAGNYSITVTDNNGCKDSLYVSISDANGPPIDVDSVQQAGCILNGGNGAIYTTANGTGPFTYQWTNGATTDDITGLGIGIFGITVADLGTGCKSSRSTYIRGQRPGTAQICLASVDTMTNHNLIIWNDTVQGIAWYEIFRETSTQGNYNSIALIQAGNGNTYEDTLANVDQRPWRYKIKATDSCDISSIYSVQHKTIHLIISPGVVSGLDLSWDQYQGISYPTFYILRHHTSTGWLVIDSVPSTSITYNDPNPPSGTLKYAIEIHAQNSCGITRGAINTSRSNIKVTTYTGIAENSFSNLFNIYPNPAASTINIAVERALSNVTIELRDLLGRLVFSEKSSSFKTKSIDINALNEGVYYLKVSGKDAEFTRKVIVQR